MRIGSKVFTPDELVTELIFGDTVTVRAEHPLRTGTLRLSYRLKSDKLAASISADLTRSLAVELARKLMEFARTGELKPDRTASGHPRRYYCGQPVQQPGFEAVASSGAAGAHHHANCGRVLDARGKPFENRVPVRLRG